MGDGTEQNPYTREDVLLLIEEHGGTAEGLDLIGRWFENGIDLSELDLKGAWLGVAHLEGANFRETHLEGADLVAARLEGADFRLSHLEGANLRFSYLEGVILGGVEVSRDTKLDSVHWGNYVLGEEKKAAAEEKRVWYTLASYTYCRLKIWYTEHGMYNIAGKFFYREMEVRRKAQSWKKEPVSKLWSWVMRLLCGYGERYENVVVAALVIIFCLAIAYIFGGIDILHSIYFSLVSFTALGYGSWMPEPAGWIKALGAFESFVGVFIMALFLITFVRKMTR